MGSTDWPVCGLGWGQKMLYSYCISTKYYCFKIKIIGKIRIGYILKSADVGTLFSSRYSENSSHAHTRRHSHTFTHTCAHYCTIVHTYAHPPILRTPTHTHAHPFIPAHTQTYPHTHAHMRSSSRTHSSSSRWVWTDQSYVIRPNTKKADRRKKERKKEGTRVRWKHQRTKNWNI